MDAAELRGSGQQCALGRTVDCATAGHGVYLTIGLAFMPIRKLGYGFRGHALAGSVEMGKKARFHPSMR